MLFSVAARQQQRVWMRYRSKDDAETEREFDPYGLVYRGGYWYLVGWCHLRADLRMFRLDRVQDAEAGTATFTRPADFDNRAFIVQSLATMRGTWQVNVTLMTTPEAAAQMIAPELGTLTPTPAGVRLCCFIESLGWMARFLVSLGCPLVVHEPPELRAELRRLAAEIAALGAEL